MTKVLYRKGETKEAWDAVSAIDFLGDLGKIT